MLWRVIFISFNFRSYNQKKNLSNYFTSSLSACLHPAADLLGRPSRQRRVYLDRGSRWSETPQCKHTDWRDEPVRNEASQFHLKWGQEKTQLNYDSCRGWADKNIKLKLWYFLLAESLFVCFIFHLYNNRNINYRKNGNQ